MVTNRTLVAAAALVFALAGCGTSGGDDTTATSKGERTTTTEATSTTAPADDDFADEVQELLEELDRAIDDEMAQRDDAARANDLDGGVASAAELRTTVYEFDAEVRDLTPPAGVAELVNGLLETDLDYIEALDAFAAVTSVDEYNDAIDAEGEARDAWEEAANELAEELGTDGVEPGVGGGAEPGDAVPGLDGTDDDGGPNPAPTDGLSATPEGTTVDAGDLVVTSTFAAPVPEGWLGQVVDNTIGFTKGVNSGGVFFVAEAGGDLAGDAAAAAESSGDVVVDGPIDTAVGDQPAVAYLFTTTSSSSAMSIYFTDPAGAALYEIRLDTTPEAFAAEVAAFESVLPEFRFR